MLIYEFELGPWSEAIISFRQALNHLVQGQMFLTLCLLILDCCPLSFSICLVHNQSLSACAFHLFSLALHQHFWWVRDITVSPREPHYPTNLPTADIY